MTWGKGDTIAPWADAEQVLIEYMTARLAASPLSTRPEVQGVTVGAALPSSWKARESAPFLRITIDGTPSTTGSVVANTTIRLVAWHRSRTSAKALAALGHALLLVYPGSPEVAGVGDLTGLQPGRDPDNGGDLCAATVTARVRAVAL